MNSMNFHNPEDGTKISITDEMIDKIKKLKSYTSDTSGYTPGGIILQWRYDENKDIITLKELKELHAALQFITMTGIITDEFREKWGMEYHHEALLRRLYLDEYQDDNGRFCITMGYKRPFGNSHVSGDIADEMLITAETKGEYYPYMGDTDEDYEINEDLVEKEYLKFINILDNFFKEFELKYKHFEGFNRLGLTNHNRERFEWGKHLPQLELNVRYGVHSYLDSWKPCKSEMRNELIDKILE